MGATRIILESLGSGPVRNTNHNLLVDRVSRYRLKRERRSTFIGIVLSHWLLSCAILVRCDVGRFLFGLRKDTVAQNTVKFIKFVSANKEVMLFSSLEDT